MRVFMGPMLDIWRIQMENTLERWEANPNSWRVETKKVEPLSEVVFEALTARAESAEDRAHAERMRLQIRYGFKEPYEVDFPKDLRQDPDRNSKEGNVVKLHAIIEMLNSGTVMGPWRLKQDGGGKLVAPRFKKWEGPEKGFEDMKLRFHPTIAVKKKLNPHGRPCADLKSSGHNAFIDNALAHVVLPQPIDVIRMLTGKSTCVTIDHVAAFSNWAMHESQWNRFAFTYKQ